MRCRSSPAWRSAASSSVSRTGWSATSSSAARDARERITLYPEKKVVFVRESGNVDGFIVNEVLGGDDDLRLRFSFALQLVDAPSDSPEEREFRQIMERDYLKAVDATLGAIRQMVADPQYAK
jgi:Domain of unknown function (DUF1857)